MRAQQINALFDRLQNAPFDDLYDIEADFFLALQGVGAAQLPDFAVAFLVLSNWLGNALRSGVSSYYEIAPANDLKTASCYLRQNGTAGLADILESGIRDGENGGDTKQWTEESARIDRWIFSHEDSLYQWMREILLENRAALSSLLGGDKEETPPDPR